jgi:hypothetical protein
MTDSQYKKLTLGLITLWFAFSFTAAALHLYVTTPPRPPLPILLAVLAPIAVFLIWMTSSAAFRRFVLSLDPRLVTMLHAWRLGGFSFLVLYAYGILPGLFALPAGLGDMAIGVTAPFVAFRLIGANHRTRFLVWQTLGILDLVVAVSMGALSQFVLPLGPGAFPMAVLPLSLIPTFAVPLLLILHIISIAQVRSWNQSSYSSVPSSVLRAV